MCHVLYFDLAKAFDTVPHDRLINKIENIGISGTLLEWIKEYLENRTFSVKVESSFSSKIKMTSGVPQGSILGPLLFLIYISDLPKKCHTENVTPKLFADDLEVYML